MTIAFISHPACEAHDLGPVHPESPQRLRAINDHLLATGLDLALRHYDAPQVSRGQLQRVHAASYIDEVFAKAPDDGTVWLDPDTGMMAASLPAALHAAGAAVLATELVLDEKADQAFCSVRPPGHHAERDRAMGFCVFNNLAVGAAHALTEYGVQRLAIVDFDVHHGNGTEQIFRDDARVMMCSTFRHPFYPFSGADTHSERFINVPLAAGSKGEDFRAAVMQQWLPALRAFKPQILYISAGFDAHLADDMGGLSLLESDYYWVTAELKQLMLEVNGLARMISVLEGGYETGALARSVAAHLKGMLDG
ncbi:MAG: histone deacetylase family protein [Gammaproteobacteria bacterium]|nr:histone deacetylase family protein [Gammaproteobacteria bacterium]